MKHHPLAFALVASIATACTGSDTDLETAFCAGLEAAAARTVDAAPTADDADDITDSARVDIALAAVDGQFGGFVTYTPDEAGSFAFGLTDDVELIVRDEAGDVVAVDTSVASTQCDALAMRHTFTLRLETYTLEIAPTDVDRIGIIAEESDDDL